MHADETGWRENRVNGYVWTCSAHLRSGTSLRRGRGGEVVDEALGEEFGGILASDFYAAYDHYPGLKATVLGPPAAGHPQAEGAVPGGCSAGEVGQRSAVALRPGPGLGQRPEDASRHGESWSWKGDC